MCRASAGRVVVLRWEKCSFTFICSLFVSHQFGTQILWMSRWLSHINDTCSPVTTDSSSKPVDNCGCCRPASWLGSVENSGSQQGCHLWFDFFGHTGPAVSAPLLHSYDCMLPIPRQTSWENTTLPVESTRPASQSLMHMAGIYKWQHDKYNHFVSVMTVPLSNAEQKQNALLLMEWYFMKWLTFVTFAW